MKINFKRALALLLCAVMVFGLLPMQQVKAEDDYFIGGFVANNTAELVEALTEAERLVAPEKIVTIQIGESFELTENVSVPGGCRLDVPVSFTIGAGVTMAVFGNLEVVAEMSNQGTLNNNGNVTVYGNAGGVLSFAETGSYTGSGEMMVINSTYEDIIPGIDLSGYDAVLGEGIGGVRWTITPKESAELVPDEWGFYTFSTMEQLKQLENATFEELTYAAFNGSEFVFESIGLPDNLVLNMPEANVTIPAGVNVKLGTIQCTNLTVEGTLDARQVEPRSSLTVSGSMGVRDHFLLKLDTQVVGMENITRAISCQFWREGSASTAEELKAALARAESATDDATYSIWFSGDGITLEEDLAIPSNFRLYVNAPLTVGTLNLDGALVIQEAGSVNVQGDLLFGPYSGVSGGAKLTVENGMAQRVFLAASSVELLRAGNRAAYPVWEGATDIIEVTDTFVLEHDVTIPAGCTLRVPVEMTVGAATKLTVNGVMELMAPVTNQGTIVNNGNVTIYGNIGTVHGTLTFAENSHYTGSGVMEVMNSTYEDILPGLDLTDFNMEFREGFGGIWTLTYNGPSEPVPDQWGNYTFSTMEELKQLASMTFERWTWANYAGEEPFVIDESITLPNNLPLGSNGAAIEIAEGVVVDVHEGHFDKLVVNGTLNIQSLQVYRQLDVNGTVHIINDFYMNEEAVVNGKENLSFNDNATWGIYCNAYDVQQLKEYCAKAAAEENAGYRYVIYMRQEMELDEDMTAPVNVRLVPQFTFTVQEGVTLTLECEYCYFITPIIVKGTLVNNGWFNVNYPDAVLTFEEGAVYSGEGVMVIHGITEGDPMVAIPGLDTTGYELQAWQDGTTWQLVPEGYNPGGEGGNVGLTFSSIEELKELAAQSYDSWTWVTYTGTEVLEITEDIVLPENLNVKTSTGVRIAQGVNARFRYLDCGWLEVNGNLHVDYAEIAEQGLWVEGYLTVEESLGISDTVSISHIDHIIMVYGGTINIQHNDTNMNLAWLKELIANLDPYEPAMIRHIVNLNAEEIVIEEDLTIPSKVNVYFQQPLTVAAGATLTLDSDNVQLYAPAVVYGTLENNSWMFVNAWDSVTLTIAEGGSYTGSGTISLEKDPSVSLESVLPGLDLSQWEVRQDGDYWWYISPIGGGGNGLTFSTLEELKALAAESYDGGYMVYAGSEDFVISEDISLPVNTYVDFGEHNVVVNQGVTASFMEMQCHDLTVYGTLNAEYVYVTGDITVNGAVKTMHLSINETSSIAGLENIKFTNSYNPLARVYYVNSGDALVAALKKAANPQLPKETALIQFNGGPVVLTEDATLPKNCEMYISNDMVIAEGATLTVNGMVSLGCPMTVKGTLVNNCDIYTWEGSITVADGGKYEGRGYLRVMGGNDYNNVFHGMNLEDFQISKEYNEWRLVYVAGLAPVAAPSELEWGYTYKDGVKVALPGAACWKSGITNTTGVEYVYFYRINEDGSETLINEFGGVGYDAKNYMDGYNSCMDLVIGDIPSGKYYFTVYSQGDYKNTKDSETVTSPVWEYTKPDAQLETATNLGWSDDAFRAQWTNPNGADEVHYARVNWYYKDREDGMMYVFAGMVADTQESGELTEFLMAMMGTGYYSYAVQFISADITKATSSKLSEQSGWYHLEKMPETPTAQLGGLLNDSTKTDEEKLEEVQNMDTEVLKDIIEENADAMDILVRLETEVAGGTAQINVSAEVSEEIAELVDEEISIVGANLNSKEDNSLDVTLVIDKVGEEREITGNYDTSTAVQFSMTLDNVKDTKNLDVPVVVTIPVPAGIAADKVVVLHYHDDGTYDVINPEVSIVNGKAYAKFVLTSFSDFAILEKLAALLGDVDLNAGVDVDDVLALLWYVLFPDMYPIGDVTADFDHNGSVDVDDVLTLLWYVLFPDMYPLTPPEPVKPVMGTVIVDKLNVRTEPSTSSYPIVKQLDINTRVEILEQQEVYGTIWGRIAEGWIPMNYVQLDAE